MRGRFILCAVGALLIAAPPAMAQTGDRPAPAKTVKAKKKKPAVVRRPEPATRDPNAGQVTPAPGPGILRGGRDEGM